MFNSEPDSSKNNIIKNREVSLPADLSVLQIVAPSTATSLPDHTNCNGGNCEVAG